MIKICVVTGSRADYGILEPLIKRLHESDDITLELIATGSHLSRMHGLTGRHIKYPHHQVECTMASGTPYGICKSLGIVVHDFAHIKPWNFDCVVLLGDRYEILGAALACYIQRIPIAHIHGGESTYGNYDDAFRHSISHMASLHFTATQQSTERLYQMGQKPQSVYNVGAMGIEDLSRVKSTERIRSQVVVCYHPVTLDGGEDREDFQVLLDYLVANKKKYTPVFIRPNSDNGGAEINKMIDVTINKMGVSGYAWEVYASMSRGDFIELLNESWCLVGNSSAGIIETPAMGMPSINIGKRQMGRAKAESVINTPMTAVDLSLAFRVAYDDNFIKSLDYGDYEQPYSGDQDGVLASLAIYNVLKRVLPITSTMKEWYNAS